MYIFGGQLDNFYLDDIAAFDMKTSKEQNYNWSRFDCLQFFANMTWILLLTLITHYLQ